MSETNNNYSKNFFSAKNILIYAVIAIIVYGLGYYFLVAKKGGYNPATSTYPTSTPAATATSAANESSSMSVSQNMANNKLTVSLSQENSSKETGTAVLSEENGKTTVEISLTGYPAGISQPAHIHIGNCPGVGTVKYPLKDVVNGKSTTVLDVTLAQLKSEEPLAINVHKSAAQISDYVACGEIK